MELLSLLKLTVGWVKMLLTKVFVSLQGSYKFRYEKLVGFNLFLLY